MEGVIWNGHVPDPEAPTRDTSQNNLAADLNNLSKWAIWIKSHRSVSYHIIRQCHEFIDRLKLASSPEGLTLRVVAIFNDHYPMTKSSIILRFIDGKIVSLPLEKKDQLIKDFTTLSQLLNNQDSCATLMITRDPFLILYSHIYGSLDDVSLSEEHVDATTPLPKAPHDLAEDIHYLGLSERQQHVFIKRLMADLKNKQLSNMQDIQEMLKLTTDPMRKLLNTRYFKVEKFFENLFLGTTSTPMRMRRFYLEYVNQARCSEFTFNNDAIIRSIYPFIHALTVRGLTLIEIQSLNVETLQFLPKTMTELSLFSCNGLDDRAFRTLHQFHLTFLSISSCVQYTGAGSFGSRIVELSIANCPNIDVKQLAANLKKAPSLQSLKLTNIDKPMRPIVESLHPNLTRLEISGCNLDEESLKILLLKLKNLHSFLLNCKKDQNTGQALLHVSSTLKKFKLHAKDVDEKNLKLTFLKCRLIVVNLSSTEISGECLEVLESAKKVFLSCRHITKINLLKAFTNNRVLEYLSLKNNAFNGSELINLPQSIKELIISNSKKLTDTHLIEVFKRLINLQQLDICETSISGECLLHINPEIEQLDLSACQNVSEELLCQVLKRLTSLKILNVGFVQSLKGEFLKFVPKTLSTLHVEECYGLKESDLVKGVQELPNLTELYLSGREEINFLHPGFASIVKVTTMHS